MVYPIFNYTVWPTLQERLHDYICNKLHVDTGNKYDDFSPILFTDVKRRTIQGSSWLGHITLFDTLDNPTVAHEVVHTLGVAHTLQI